MMISDIKVPEGAKENEFRLAVMIAFFDDVDTFSAELGVARGTGYNIRSRIQKNEADDRILTKVFDAYKPVTDSFLKGLLAEKPIIENQ